MLRSTFLGFEVAKRGIQTSQKGLDISGHNMVNWDSQGYTRQRVDQVSVSPYYHTSRYSYGRVGNLGQGVGVTGIGQIRDSFLDKRFRDEQSDNAYYETASNILSDLESTIGEFHPDSSVGIRGSLETLLPAILSFSETPYSETAANILQTEFKNLTMTIRQLSAGLDKVAAQNKYDLKVSVDDVNEKLQSLADLNYAINRASLGIDNNKYGPNELLDARNLILDELSSFGDLDVQVNGDNTVTVKMGGKLVVDEYKAEKIEYVENNDNTVSLRWVSSGERCNFAAGALKGYTDFINGRGSHIVSSNETNYKGVLYYHDQLDTLATTLVNVVNSIVPDTFDTDGTPLTYKTLLGGISDTADSSGHFPVTTSDVSASNISVSDEWLSDTSYVIAYPENKENNYILALYSALNANDINFVGRGESFSGTLFEFVDSYSSVLAEDLTFYSGRFDTSSTTLNDIHDRKDAVAGVSLDEETTNLLMYNKSFQAASRLMNTLDEALDKLINGTGLVGR